MAKTYRHGLKILHLFIELVLIVVFAGSGLSIRNQALAASGAPVLKWQLGGCYQSWCETGWQPQTLTTMVR
jgi:hypothetical protein